MSGTASEEIRIGDRVRGHFKGEVVEGVVEMIYWRSSFYSTPVASVISDERYHVLDRAGLPIYYPKHVWMLSVAELELVERRSPKEGS